MMTGNCGIGLAATVFCVLNTTMFVPNRHLFKANKPLFDANEHAIALELIMFGAQKVSFTPDKTFSVSIITICETNTTFFATSWVGEIPSSHE